MAGYPDPRYDPNSPEYDPALAEAASQAQPENAPYVDEQVGRTPPAPVSQAGTAQPMPAGAPRAELEIPSGEQEYTFDGNVQSVPGWISKDWAGYDRGPALHVPQGPAVGNDGPYTTKTAYVGDTIRFIPNKGAYPAHYEVTRSDMTPVEGVGTLKPPQQSAASLEDMVRTGTLAPDELGEDAKAQVVGRTPAMKKVIEGDQPAPEPQPLAIKMP